MILEIAEVVFPLMLEIAEVVRFHVSESVNLYPCLDLAGLKSFKAFAVIGAGVLGLRSFATIVYTGDQLSLASLRYFSVFRP